MAPILMPFRGKGTQGDLIASYANGPANASNPVRTTHPFPLPSQSNRGLQSWREMGKSSSKLLVTPQPKAALPVASRVSAGQDTVLSGLTCPILGRFSRNTSTAAQPGHGHPTHLNQLRIRPAGRPITCALEWLAAFSPSFLAGGRGQGEQQERQSL